MTDWKARCATLIDKIDYTWGDIPDDVLALIDRTRAELAQPEPEGMPDHVNLIGFALEREPWATWLRRGGFLESAHCELSDLMLAALARFGRPAIELVPTSEPEVKP